VFIVCNTWIAACFLTAVDVKQVAQGIQEKRLQEVMQYQTLLTDLEQWLITVNASLRTEQPTSPQAIKGQLGAHEVSRSLLLCDLVMCVNKTFIFIFILFAWYVGHCPASQFFQSQNFGSWFYFLHQVTR
jgi:hypothetical protein